jgi:hypothetical protein
MLIGWNFAVNTDKMIEKSTHSNNTRSRFKPAWRKPETSKIQFAQIPLPNGIAQKE